MLAIFTTNQVSNNSTPSTGSTSKDENNFFKEKSTTQWIREIQTGWQIVLRYIVISGCIALLILGSTGFSGEGAKPNGKPVQKEYITMALAWNQTLKSRDISWGLKAVEVENRNIIVIEKTRFFADYWNFSYKLWCFDADGIQLWDQCLDTPTSVNIVSILESSEVYYVIGNQAFQGNISPSVLEFDLSGKLLEKYTFAFNESRRVSDACRLPDGSMLLVGCYQFSIDSFQIWAMKINDSGSIFWTKEYGLFWGWDVEITGVESDAQGGAVIIGKNYGAIFDDGMALCIDNNGNMKWFWEYEWGNTFYDVQECENGDFIFTGYSSSLWKGEEEGTIVVRTDEESNVIWERVFKQPFIGPAPSIIKLDQGSYLIAINNENSNKAGFLCLDDEGDVLWKMSPELDAFSFSEIIQCQNGDIVTTGRMRKAMWIARWHVDKAPTQPILSIQAVGGLTGDILLMWFPSEDPDGYIVYYQLQKAAQENFEVFSVQKINGISCFLVNVTDGQYWFRVRAIDDLGGVSLWSNKVTLTLNRTMTLFSIFSITSLAIIGEGSVWVTVYTVIQIRNLRIRELSDS